MVDLVRRVVAGEFDPPRALKPWIPKPLDAIVVKAMANDPVNRYATANDLAKDLERYLADEPVVALPETWTMRTGRWLRRHRSLVVTGAGALALVTLVSLVAAFWINSARRQEAASKERAVQLFAQARGSVDTWMSGVGEIVRFYPECRGRGNDCSRKQPTPTRGSPNNPPTIRCCDSSKRGP